MPNALIGTSWFPVATMILGFALSAVGEFLRDGRTSKRDEVIAKATLAREREARQEARRAQLFEGRGKFQRETLLTLQDAVVKLTRAAGQMHHLDCMESRKTGKWGGQLFPEEVSNNALEFSVSVMVFASRVRDNEVRQMAETFRNRANMVGICKTEETSSDALNEMGKILEPLHARIGELLRQMDDDEEAQYQLTPASPLG